MGRYNSSKTRVVPVFDQLYERDATGQSWLPYLCRAASRADLAAIPATLGSLVPNHPRWWGENERRLRPPKELLTWLVHNITEAQVLASGDSGAVYAKRLGLAQGDPHRVKDALDGISSGAWYRKWYALEGASAPDAFLETDRTILVVEGKRTEYACTTKTKWMPERSQLLRHMDAALEIANGRLVLGLLIVEGNPERPLELDSWWTGQIETQVSERLVRDSLPHRSADERRLIVNGVLGAITWQRLCDDLAITWPPDGIAV